ncbi:serine hydrolase [Clostridium sp.]|uniref:serine hydrolase n=1 Tax=Clostridium sp. TaxID=1506 RepID=UPI002FC97F1B
MKEIKRYLESKVGNYSFYFEDLKSGYTYGFNEEVEMPAAGCIKLPIAMALMKEVEQKNISLKDIVSIGDEDKVDGDFGIIHEFSDKEYAIKELLIAMLIQSDNTAASKIINILGMNNINNLIKNMGLKSTKVNKYPSDVRVENRHENITTSYDLSQCFKLLHNKVTLTDEHSDLILNILKRHQLAKKILFYFPREVQLCTANKIGTLESVENDTVLMNLPKGNFVATMMSSELPTNVYGSTTIARAGKMMFDMIDKDWN